MTVRDFMMTMNLDDYINRNKIVPDTFINFSNIMSCCINLIGNPTYCSSDFNSNQIQNIIKQYGKYEIEEWKLEVDSDVSRCFYFTVRK